MVTNKRVYAILILIAIGALSGVLFLRFRHDAPRVETKVPQTVLRGAFVNIPITVADSDAKRSQGLSGTRSLDRGTGKLFIFENPGIYGFWMKDMHYSLDMVWIDAAMKVVGVTTHVAPESYPEVFYAPSEMQYVLEVNAGEARALGLVEGTQLSL